MSGLPLPDGDLPVWVVAVIALAVYVGKPFARWLSEAVRPFLHTAAERAKRADKMTDRLDELHRERTDDFRARWEAATVSFRKEFEQRVKAEGRAEAVAQQLAELGAALEETQALHRECLDDNRKLQVRMAVLEAKLL